MKTTIHERNNPFSTFALRGGRLRKSCRGVVSSALFLTGMATLVLGAMFALSTPSFAQNVGTGSENVEIINRNPIRTSSTGISAGHYGTGDIDITNKSTIDANNSGIDVDHAGIDGDIEITNEGTSSGETWYGIIARHTNHASDGNIKITNKGTAGGKYAVYSNSESSGDIKIINEGTIDGASAGLIARHRRTGDIEITNKNLIRGRILNGIRARQIGLGGGDIVNYQRRNH